MPSSRIASNQSCLGSLLSMDKSFDSKTRWNEVFSCIWFYFKQLFICILSIFPFKTRTPRLERHQTFFSVHEFSELGNTQGNSVPESWETKSESELAKTRSILDLCQWPIHTNIDTCETDRNRKPANHISFVLLSRKEEMFIYSPAFHSFKQDLLNTSYGPDHWALRIWE